ncbi:hypothetical protein [Paraburkholderia aspalathi]|uniref:hypothetical protein n=1 Tax=Paraburkholderia aspalathi TaxID=1324617 RepID=UPI0038B9D48C
MSHTLLPVDGEVLAGIGPLDLVLPYGNTARRSDEVTVVIGPTANKKLRRNISGIDEMLGRRQAFFGQRLMNVLRAHRFMDIGCGGMHVSNQVCAIVITGFRGYKPEPQIRWKFFNFNWLDVFDFRGERDGILWRKAFSCNAD